MNWGKGTRLLVSCLACCVSSSVCSQQAYNLTQCLNYALEHAPALKKESLNQRKSTAENDAEKSRFLPRIEGYANYNHYFNALPTYIFPPDEGSILAGTPLSSPYPLQLGLPHNLNAGIQIDQPLFDMQFFGNASLQKHVVVYNNLKLDLVEENTLYQIALLFFKTAGNIEKMDFLNANLLRLQKLKPLVTQQVKQGFAKPTDLDKLLVKTANLQSKKNQLKNGIDQQLRYLKLMMGMSPGDNLQIDHQAAGKLTIPADSMENRVFLEEKILEEQRQLYQQDAHRRNAIYYPRLHAYATLLFQAQRQKPNFFASGQDWYNIHQWGLNLTIPIFQGMAHKSDKEIAEIVDEQLAFGIAQKKARGQVEMQNALAALQAARQDQQAQQQNVALAERMYRQSELGYRQGTILLMDFLDAEATLREARMMFATANLETKIAELSMLKSSGQLKKLVTP